MGRAPPWTPGRREEGGPEKAGIEPRQPGSWWSRCFPAPCSECGLLARGPLSFPSFWAFGQKAGGPGQHPLGARPGLGSGSEPGSEGGVTRRHHGAATHVTCTGGWPVTPLPPRPSPPTGGSMGQAASGNRGAGLRPWGPGSRSPHSGWRVGRMDDGKGDVGSGGGAGTGTTVVRCLFSCVLLKVGLSVQRCCSQRPGQMTSPRDDRAKPLERVAVTRCDREGDLYRSYDGEVAGVVWSLRVPSSVSLRQGGRGALRKHKGPCDHRQSDVATSQEFLGPPGAGRGRKGPRRGSLEGASPAHASTLVQ